MRKTFTYKGKPYDFNKIVIRMAEAKQHIPLILGNTAVNFFKNRFRAQAWTDKSAERWKQRKGNTDPGRAILVKSGALRRANRIDQATFKQTVISNDRPYAEAHNEGVDATVQVRQHTRRVYSSQRVKYTTRTGNQRSRTEKVAGGAYTVRSHTRKMKLPKRQFMGDSELLDRKIDQELIKVIDSIFDI